MENKRTTRSHWNQYVDGDNVIRMPKKSYNTEADALSAARIINAYGNSAFKMVSYKCSKCDKWHIGHNGTYMTKERREEAKDKLKHKII